MHAFLVNCNSCKVQSVCWSRKIMGSHVSLHCKAWW